MNTAQNLFCVQALDIGRPAKASWTMSAQWTSWTVYNNLKMRSILWPTAPDRREQVLAFEFSVNSGGLAQFRIEREGVSHFLNLLADAIESLVVFVVVQGVGDPGAYLPHFFVFHATRRESSRTDADAAGLERRIHVKGDCIFINSDSGVAQGIFG